MKALKGIKLKDNRILIKDFELVKETKGGIILPEDQWETPVGGLIVSVGPGLMNTTTGELIPMTCSVGEKVQYHKHGTEVEVNGEKYYLLRDTDVWGEIQDTKS